MKRIIALLMIGMLLFGVSACSKDNESQTSSAESKETATVTSDAVSSDLQDGASSQAVTSVEDDSVSSEVTSSILTIQTESEEMPKFKDKLTQEEMQEFNVLRYVSGMEDPNMIVFVLTSAATEKLGLFPGDTRQTPGFSLEVLKQLGEMIGFEIASPRTYSFVGTGDKKCVLYKVLVKNPEQKSNKEIYAELKNNENILL